MSGIDLPPSMGVATAINFQPTEEGRAAGAGDFVMTADEVQGVIRALEENGITVVALRNHMLTEEPRLFFLHFWANDDAIQLASGLRAGARSDEGAAAIQRLSAGEARSTVAGKLWERSRESGYLGDDCFRVSHRIPPGVAGVVRLIAHSSVTVYICCDAFLLRLPGRRGADRRGRRPCWSEHGARPRAGTRPGGARAGVGGARIDGFRTRSRSRARR